MVKWQDTYSVNHTVMDNIHQEFITLLNETLATSGPTFDNYFEALMLHTKEHFAFEELEMERVSLGSRREHCDEHQRILAEMKFFHSKAQNGRRSFARAYLQNQLPHWLRQHTATMDADLATRLS